MATYIHLPEVSGIYQIVNNTTEKRYESIKEKKL